MKRYLINELFTSLQGEGVNAGRVMHFVRFAKCNLSCSKEREGFDCDTDFERGSWYTADELVAALQAEPPAEWVLFTGGEPSLQLDQALVKCLLPHWRLGIETNGTFPLPAGLEWVCVSPKPGHSTVVDRANEWKFVMGPNDALPDCRGDGWHLLSPRFDGDTVDREALDHCIELVRANPRWRLSCQSHKWWGVR